MVELVANKGDRARDEDRAPESKLDARWGSPLLHDIGVALDLGHRCVVYDRGFVRPAANPIVWKLAGRLEGVMSNGANQGERPGGSGRRRPGAGGEAGGEAREAAPATARGASASVERQLASLDRLELDESAKSRIHEALCAYPQFGVRSVSAGFWISGRVQPVFDLSVTATMSTFIPRDERAQTQAWAWWEEGVWIGPRHTYKDGSICAFELRDRTWVRGESIATLLDLQVVWICRQMFLREYGRWPGRQMIHSPLERVLEQHRGEFCGCGSDDRYEACCRDRDLAFRASAGPFAIARVGQALTARRPAIPAELNATP
jgi:hypothetical protein